MNTTTFTASAPIIIKADRNEKGQFTNGYPGGEIARLAARQATQKRIDSNPHNVAFLAAHGLGHIDPSEIFAG